MMKSMFSGVSGLMNHQKRMDVVGNNIANVNTVGFKSDRMMFEDEVSQTYKGATAPNAGLGGSNPVQVGMGVRESTIDTIHTQGSLQSSGSPTDMAISGSGFFVVSDGQKNLYTRAGNFALDAQANLVNAAGYTVMGWPAVSGVVNPAGPLVPVNIPLGARMVAQPTTTSTIMGNLDAGAPVGPASDFVTVMTMYDSLGNQRAVTVTFQKTALNNWSWTATGVGVVPGVFNQGTVTFSPLGAVTGSTGSLELDNSSTGATTPQAIPIDFSQMSQFSTPSQVSLFDQDGFSTGVLETFSAGRDGIITGIYTNGLKIPLAGVAMASLPNPAGLSKLGGNLYDVTPNSGVPQVGPPAQSGRGALVIGAVEMSNVNLADEFTNMIITERGFQANSRIISVADEMLQDLVNLKR